MDLTRDEELIALRNDLVEDMAGFLEELEEGGEEAEYTTEHVERCGRLVDSLLAALSKAADEAAARDCVKMAVEDLNDLNEQAGEQMIETDQREQLCHIIDSAWERRGFGAADDIAGPWRRW